MTLMIRRLSAVLTIALLFGPLALAQNSTPQMLKPNTTPTVIPIWNLHSGQIEALLVLENDPPVHGRAWVRAPQQLGDSSAILGTATNFSNGMAIFCSGQAGGFNQLSALGDCQFGKSSTRYPAINIPGLQTKSTLSCTIKQIAGARYYGLLFFALRASFAVQNRSRRFCQVHKTA